MMDVNLKGVFLCSRAVLPSMMKQQKGEIINIASLAGKNSFCWRIGLFCNKMGIDWVLSFIDA